MGIIDKFKNIIMPGAGDSPYTKAERNRMTLIVDELMYAFNESLEHMSTSRSLMFHTAFVVYVPFGYYQEINKAFGYITKEVVENFHDRIRRLLNRKKSEMKFCPLSEKWSFDLIPLMEHGSDTPYEDNPDSRLTYEELEERFVAVRSSAVPEQAYNFEFCNDDDIIKTNRSQPNSRLNQMENLSIAAVRGLKPSGQGYEYPMLDLTGGQVASSSGRGDGNRTHKLATLKCAEDNVDFLDSRNNKYKILDIQVPDFFVGGNSASSTYQGRPMLRLNSDQVMSPHFEIRRQPDGAFYIRAIGYVEQGNIEMPRGEWKRLSDRNASLNVNGIIELIFNKA